MQPHDGTGFAKKDLGFFVGKKVLNLKASWTDLSKSGTGWLMCTLRWNSDLLNGCKNRNVCNVEIQYFVA